MVYDERTRDEAVKYTIVVKYLKDRIENHEKLDKKEIKKLLEALNVEVKEKTTNVECGF